MLENFTEFWALHPWSISDTLLCDLNMAHNSSTKLSSTGLMCSEDEMCWFSFAVNTRSSRIQSGHMHTMIVVNNKAHSSVPTIQIVPSTSKSFHPQMLLNHCFFIFITIKFIIDVRCYCAALMGCKCGAHQASGCCSHCITDPNMFNLKH